MKLVYSYSILNITFSKFVKVLYHGFFQKKLRKVIDYVGLRGNLFSLNPWGRITRGYCFSVFTIFFKHAFLHTDVQYKNFLKIFNHYFDVCN